MCSSQSYSQIPKWKLWDDPSDLENNSEAIQTEKKNQTNRWRMLFFLLIGLLFSIFVLSAFVDISGFMNRQPTGLKYHCGKSIAEAKAHGCDFEVLSGAWMPKACQDDDLNEEFRAMNWTYWADSDKRVVIPEEKLAEREGEEGVYYTTQRWHVTHCAFQWRKLHKAWETGKEVEMGEHALGSMDHTLHCGSLYTDEVDLDSIQTRITVEFFDC